MRRPTPPRERRGGTCPPARPGGSSFLGMQEIKTLAMPLVVRVTSRGLSAFSVARRLVPVFQLLRHLLENSPLIARQAVETVLQDLVQHHVELIVRTLRRDLRTRRRR